MSSKKFISIGLVCAMLAGTVLAGCNNGTANTNSQTPTQSTSEQSASGESIKLPENGGFTTTSYELSKDKYRTYYEIFPYSFYDSDGDGIGDFKGITSKLDYLNDGDTKTTTDLGVEGIWLMPIMPSPSYHKYNISDYKAIDKAYGTMDDFKEFLTEAHKRNINVIIDFVINHTSRQHEWYQKAIEELKAGKTDGYVQYYHFKENNDEKGWNKAGVGDWYYECEFDADMPDLNLTNEKVRSELEDIVKFWLDMGVDGFRLDAVKYYESTGTEDSVKDLKWLYDYAKSVKDDVYMVGECWDASGVIANYYKSGVDSFFNFDMQGATGRVNTSLNKEDALGYAQSLEKWQDTIKASNPNAIDAPFISNHDTARSAGFLSTLTSKKMAAAMYILAPGNSFIYYGEEIGMTGSKTDPDKRTGMYWESKDAKGYVKSIPQSTNRDVPEKSVKEQLEDENSLLSFYKRVIALKNQNPEIARGDITAVDLGNKAVSGYVSSYNDSKVMVIYNVSGKGETVTIPSDKFTVSEVRGYAVADSGDMQDDTKAAVDDLLDLGTGTESSAETSEESKITDFAVNGSQVTLPAYSVIVLK
ncbi:MAG: alpha-amylase family glycosyl hydrolase [Clostridia bacterium]|nr:alpha-amylase family glycosyl hydrolase [Clostridia bacterium]